MRRLGLRSRFLLRFPFLLLLRSGRFGHGHIHPLENRELGGVALPLMQLHDARVAAAAFLLGGRDFVEQDPDRVFLVQTRRRQPAVVQRPGLAEGDHLFGHRTRRLGLRQGGRHALVLDQAANQVGQHCVPVFAGAPQFRRSLQVSHKLPFYSVVVVTGAPSSFGAPPVSSVSESKLIPSCNPSVASFSLISFSDFLPKLRYLSISASVFIASCPTVVMFALFRQFAARTLNSISFTLMPSSFLSLVFSSSCLSTTSSNSTAFLS